MEVPLKLVDVTPTPRYVGVVGLEEPTVVDVNRSKEVVVLNGTVVVVLSETVVEVKAPRSPETEKTQKTQKAKKTTLQSI
ncbi:MAG: hypothetical protein GF414_01430 [Candidatus Altiarchaeales archaeon]|nr:hypothetical protein [Candidatus Altiarchaeales archaeon]